MKLILKDNFINEIKNVSDKIKEKSVIYYGTTLKGDNIEVYDLDNGSIKPVVRFLMTGTTKKRNLLLPIIVVLLILLLAGVLIYAYYSNNNSQAPQPKIIQNTQPKINIEPIKKESQPKIKNDVEKEKENNKIIMSEIETKTKNKEIILNNSLELTKLDLEILQKKYDNLQEENFKLKNKIALLQKENEKLTNKNNEIQKQIADTELNSFIYFLGKEVKKNCDTNKITKEKCVNLYNKYIIKNGSK